MFKTKRNLRYLNTANEHRKVRSRGADNVLAICGYFDFGRLVLMYAIRYHENGDSDVLRWEQLELPAPGIDEVLMRNMAIGVGLKASRDHEPRRTAGSVIPIP